MEVYFAATGAYHWLKLFEAQMQSQLFHLPGTSPTGAPMGSQFYGMLEPLMLYRYVIPKAGLGITLKTLIPANNAMPQGITSAHVWALRKALGLKEIPKDPLPDMKLPVSTANLWILPIGIKEDPVRLFTETGNTQEAI